MIAENMPFADYRAKEGLNASAIKKGRTSLLHLHAEMERVDSDPTPAMVLGTNIHTRVLEPERFENEVAVWRGKARRGKEWTAFKDENEGKTIVTVSELETLDQIYESVLKHPEAIEIIQESQKEVSVFWESPIYGKGKVRMDAVKFNEFWCDLKSTSRIHPREFQSHSWKMGYHIQAGWSAEAMECQGFSADVPFYLLAIESSSPFDVVLYELDSELVEMGRREAKEIACQYRLAEKRGVFEGVAADGIQVLTAPEWVKEMKSDWVIK